MSQIYSPSRPRVRWVKHTPFFITDGWKTPNAYPDCDYFSEVPKKPGVYAIVELITKIKPNGKYRCKLVYIGSSTNLYNRYRSHGIITKINKTENKCTFHFLQMDTGFYDEEIKLIKQYEPEYNKALYKNHNTLIA